MKRIISNIFGGVALIFAIFSLTDSANAQQAKTTIVGIDTDKNIVRVGNAPSGPLDVKVIGSGSARKPFQFRASVGPTNTGIASQVIPIPAGKRLVIENVSAIARRPPGFQMEINFFCYLDNGDGIGDSADITFHRIALTEQGTFGDTAIASANHKVLIFADERIGTTPMSLVLQARLSGATTSFTQAQVTFSGYVEDLPTTP